VVVVHERRTSSVLCTPRPVQRSRPLEDDRLIGGPSDVRDARSVALLQRSAGNRATAQLLHPTVQRHRDHGLGAGQGLAGVAEEAPLIEEQTVQRAATFSAGAVHETNNLANTVVNGAPVGVTTPVINGTVTATGAQLTAALARPTLTTTASAGGGFDAEISTVPTNVGSFDETVLSAGPWRIGTTKAFFHGLFPSVPGMGGAGATRLRAHGDPDDRAMQVANRRHEDHHASDTRAAFTNIVVPWDQKVTAAKAAATKYHGATAADAEAALWAAMGGTPDQIATALITRLVADTNAFHATAAGGPVSFSATTQAGASPDGQFCWLYLVNPG